MARNRKKFTKFIDKIKDNLFDRMPTGQDRPEIRFVGLTDNEGWPAVIDVKTRKIYGFVDPENRQFYLWAMAETAKRGDRYIDERYVPYTLAEIKQLGLDRYLK